MNKASTTLLTILFALFSCSLSFAQATCYSESGTVMVNSFCVCEGDQAIADADDFILEPGQSVYYVYHTDGTVTDANLPTNVVSLGSFITNDASVTGVVYVTAFGATSDGNGGPDLSDPCMVYSNTVMLTLLEPIVIYTEEFCDEEKGEFSYIFTVCGGLPEKDPTDLYQINSVFFNGQVEKGDTIAVGPITANTSYTITATDGNGCSVTITNDYDCSGPVPVTLVEYLGTVENEGNLLKWSTASEIDNDYFTLEVSSDGMNYDVVNRIEGQGTISTPTSYSYLDKSATSGTSYYRLSQTDFDGTYENLGIVQLTRGEQIFEINTVYPQPVNSELNIQFTSSLSEDVTISIYNAAGKIFYSAVNSSQAGMNSVTIDSEALSSGVYFLGLSSESKKLTQKFIKE